MSSSLLSDQVRWQQPEVNRYGIDQTRLSIASAPIEAEPFSFLVIGDTDAGGQSSHFSEGFARQLIAHLEDSRFLLHTGDVTYPVGSYENYWKGFLRPYRALISNLPPNPDYKGRPIVFNQPLLPVPGNHDYAAPDSKWKSQLLQIVCDYLRRTLKIDLGHYGGWNGEAYAQTFLDNLKDLTPEQLHTHLTTYYRTGLRYQTGHFTRLPNRYYSFRYGGVDFFALDSNTWKTAPNMAGFDYEQLDWLVNSLTRSWRTPGTIGRIIYLHHSPYTTEVSRWQQSETLWVRKHLRGVFKRVALELEQSEPRPLVDLVISGHAHCLEHLQTMSKSGVRQADAGMDWIVCGGSGIDVRSQWRTQSAEIMENVTHSGRSYPSVVAKSHLYVGNHTKKNKKQSLYSFIRVSVWPRREQVFNVVPHVVSVDEKGWQTVSLSALNIKAIDRPRQYSSC